MGTVMGIMLGLMLIGVLVWDGGHGMMGGHNQERHVEESTAVKETKDPCQQPDCAAEKSKENVNSENGGQIR